MDSAQPKQLLDQMRDVLRVKRYAYRTEESYLDWVCRYILFHDKRHPQDMAEAEMATTSAPSKNCSGTKT